MKFFQRVLTQMEQMKLMDIFTLQTYTDLKKIFGFQKQTTPTHGSHNFWIEDDILYVAMYYWIMGIVEY